MKITKNFLILPNKTIDVCQLLRDVGQSQENASQTINNTGISYIHDASEYLLSEFIFKGLSSIEQTDNHFFSNIDSVIVVSQTYDRRIPSISTRIQSKFNLKSDTFCVDLMDGCAGYINALRLASMLEKNGHKNILIIAGDLNSTITVNSVIGTKILFGDGISVTTLEADNSKTDTLSFNNGDNDNIISCSIKDNTLNMKGFEVFKFGRKIVPELINSYLDINEKSLKSYKLIGLHQASKMIVSTICSKLNYTNTLGDDFSCGKIGNIGSGSIGAWLSNIKGLENKGKLDMLAVGFGAGLSWGLASIVVDIKINKTIFI